MPGRLEVFIILICAGAIIAAGLWIFGRLLRQPDRPMATRMPRQRLTKAQEYREATRRG